MRIRSIPCLAVAVLVAALALPARSTRAQACDAASAKKIKKHNFDAMDENDRWELEKARQKLEDAKLIAQSRGCLKHPELAVTYVLLGVVEMRSRKLDAMKAAFAKALEIDPQVALPTRVQSAKIVRFFAAVKATVKVAAPAERPRPGEPTPSGPPKGFEHLPLLKWEEGKTMAITARAAEDLSVQRVSVFFKTDESAVGRRLELVQGGGDKWTWKVVVPGTMVRGKQFRYFLVAYAAGDKEVAASGNSASMHIVQLTSAAAGVPRARDGGLENPLTGGTYKRPREVERRVAARPDHPLEDPDAPVERRRATPAVGVKRTHVAPPPSPPIFFAAIGAGTGIGLMAGRTEITGEDVPGSPSLGSVYGQLELGYLITPRFSVNLFGRFGYLAISSSVKDASAAPPTSNARAKGNDKDVIVLARARYQSSPLLRADLPVNLRWFVGGGLGWGILRHLVNAKHQSTGQDVLDTDRSTGFVPNAFGGVSLCVVRSCQISVQFEVNYLATFTLDTDLNTPFHLDFTLGASFAF